MLGKKPMRRIPCRCLLLLPIVLALLAGCATSNSVVNLSHYDGREPDFIRMRQEGIVGVIHEATFPLFNRDAAYARREGVAENAGLLWHERGGDSVVTLPALHDALAQFYAVLFLLFERCAVRAQHDVRA